MKTKTLKKAVNSEKGAMDSILVSIILILFAVGLVVGFSTWYNTQQESVTTATTLKVAEATADVSNEN